MKKQFTCHVNKPNFFIGFLTLIILALASNVSAQKICALNGPLKDTIFEKKLAAFRLTNQTLLSLQPASLPCLGRTLSISVHSIEDSLGVPSVTISDAQNMIASLNTAFAPICLQFSLCKFEIIKNYKYSTFFSFTDEPEVNALYNHANMINIYCPRRVFVGSAIGVGIEFGGYSPLGGSVNSNTVLVANASGDVAIHELGHFFGLMHTFENPGSELVNGSNCATAGDLICDTEADFDATQQFPPVFIGCNYVGNLVDSNGDFYTPLLANYMSYSPCGCKFTHQQYLRMAATYLMNATTLY